MAKTIHILLVEDNEGDIFLTREAFRDRNIDNKISVVRNGVEAIDFLNKSYVETTNAAPDLVLMDLNLPRKNGQEVLKYIRDKEHLKKLPVFMLTTSSSENDRQESYKNAADFYFTKPFDITSFLEVISQIKNFRISIEKLTTNDNS
jgi:CheY-like chemotaxis protein